MVKSTEITELRATMQKESLGRIHAYTKQWLYLVQRNNGHEQILFALLGKKKESYSCLFYDTEGFIAVIRSVPCYITKSGLGTCARNQTESKQSPGKLASESWHSLVSPGITS